MLGFARAKAASIGVLVALAFSAVPPEASAATNPLLAKQAKKKKAEPAAASGDSLVPPTEEDSSDIEITVLDAGTTGKKKPAQKKGKKGKKGKTEVIPEEVVLEEEPEAPKEPEPERPRYHENWGTFSIQQDLLSFSSEGNICPSTTATGVEVPGSEQYSCRDASGVYQGEVVNGLGNSVQGGFGFATTRLLLGYERVFIDRLTLGGRIGWAFRTAPTVEGAGAALPFHLEARAAFYFGPAPFERRSIRPFASLGTGIGEIDGVVKVDVHPTPDGPLTQVDAWRKTGVGFIAFGGGAAYPIGDFAINAELRAIVMLGAPAFALGLGIGAAYGF